MQNQSPSTRIRLQTSLAVFAIYSVFVYFTYPHIGRAAAVVSIIPVFVAAILFGLRGGLVASLSNIPLTVLLFFTANKFASYQFHPEDFILAHIAIVMFGLLVGHTNDLKNRLKSELEERKKAQKEKEELITNLEAALENIKTLSGLIPICSSCKKIRDDKGYWSQIESYLESHSDAVFSHGICPECEEGLYSSETWFPALKK